MRWASLPPRRWPTTTTRPTTGSSTSTFSARSTSSPRPCPRCGQPAAEPLSTSRPSTPSPSRAASSFTARQRPLSSRLPGRWRSSSATTTSPSTRSRPAGSTHPALEPEDASRKRSRRFRWAEPPSPTRLPTGSGSCATAATSLEKRSSSAADSPSADAGVVATCKRGSAVEVDVAHQGVGVSVHQLPVVALPAEQHRHSQRPVLIRQPADLAVLPFDQHQHDEVARRIGLHHVYLRLAADEEARQLLDGLLAGVESVPGRSTERRDQRVVVGVHEQV